SVKNQRFLPPLPKGEARRLRRQTAIWRTKAFPFGEGGSPSGETDEGMSQYEFAKVPGNFLAVPPLISQKSKIFASGHYGMIAPGNHNISDSLRGAPPQRGSLGRCAPSCNLAALLSDPDKHIL
ncbi:MAG: hypothetical protein PUD80_02975, partial [Firmicutes bacterium]|nr:hypothetical protein [Bacillota bacterium]